MDVRIETLQPIHVARIRHVGPYAEVGPCFERLFRWASAINAPTGRVLTLSWDNSDAVAPQRLRAGIEGPRVATDTALAGSRDTLSARFAGQDRGARRRRRTKCGAVRAPGLRVTRRMLNGPPIAGALKVRLASSASSAWRSTISIAATEVAMAVGCGHLDVIAVRKLFVRQGTK